jgi:hypothetical protein
MKRIALWTLLWLGATVLVLGPQKVFVIVLASTLIVGSMFDTRPQTPPPIAEGQITDGDWRNWEGGSGKLTAVLERTFPAGTSEHVLKSTLLGQGFKPLPPPPPNCLPPGQFGPPGKVYVPCYDATKILKYVWGRGMVCSEEVVVHWSTDSEGKITSIKGGYHGACL